MAHGFVGNDRIRRSEAQNPLSCWLAWSNQSLPCWIYLQETWNRVFALSIISQNWDAGSWNQLILHGQYHNCWCPGDAKNQGTSNHDIDLVIPDYSRFTIRILPQYLSPRRRQQSITPSYGNVSPLLALLRGIPWSSKGGCCEALMFYLLLGWVSCWTNSRVANDFICMTPMNVTSLLWLLRTNTA